MATVMQPTPQAELADAEIDGYSWAGLDQRNAFLSKFRQMLNDHAAAHALQRGETVVEAIDFQVTANAADQEAFEAFGWTSTVSE